MSHYSDLLIAQARSAGDARLASGAAWGRAAENIAQIPGNYLAQQKADALKQQEMALRQQSAKDAHEASLTEQDKERRAQASDWAAHWQAVPNATPEQVRADARQQKFFTPADLPHIDAETATPEGTQAFLGRLAPLSGVKEADRTKDLIDNRGKLIRAGQAPPPTTPTALAFDAANPKSPTQAQSTTALDLSRPPKPEAVPRPLEQQLLEAVIAGDKTKIGQIRQTMLTAAQAKQDPDAAKLAREMAGLRVDEAKARLDALTEKAKPLDITPDISTTRSGAKYIDLSLYSAGERDRAREAASKAGATPISKEQANALQEIDNARANQQSIQNQIADILPKGPGGRVVASVAVPLSKLFQTDDQIAAYNSWRTAAIQTLRATAGSKGLRINQAEIAQAIENDIPKLTDTVGVAQQKLKNINTLLDNAEGSVVVRNRAQPSGITVTDPNGGVHTFTSQADADKFKAAAGIK